MAVRVTLPPEAGQDGPGVRTGYPGAAPPFAGPARSFVRSRTLGGPLFLGMRLENPYCPGPGTRGGTRPGATGAEG